MFCNHKYGKVEGKYQYCQKCGKAIVAPCAHKWKRMYSREYKTYNGFNILTNGGTIYFYECKICGEAKTVKFSTDK